MRRHREIDVASPAWIAKFTPLSRTVAPKGTAVPRSGGACKEALIGANARRGANRRDERGAKESLVERGTERESIGNGRLRSAQIVIPLMRIHSYGRRPEKTQLSFLLGARQARGK